MTKKKKSIVTYWQSNDKYGHQSSSLVKSYAESLGYKYITASTKEEFLANMDGFVKTEISQSIIFEVFLRAEDDTNALESARHILPISQDSIPFKKKLKQAIYSAIGKEKMEAIHTLMK